MGVAAREFLAARKAGDPALSSPPWARSSSSPTLEEGVPAAARARRAARRARQGRRTTRARGEVFARRWLSRERIVPTADIFRQLVAEAQKELRAGLVERAGLGFGAVLGAARDALRDAPHAAAELSERYDVLVVDEFQDTSRLQRDLIALLWEKEPLQRRPGVVPSLSQVRGSGLLVVGDRKQSIYSFRGADVAVFTETCVELAGEAARAALAVPEGACAVPASPERRLPRPPRELPRLARAAALRQRFLRGMPPRARRRARRGALRRGDRGPARARGEDRRERAPGHVAAARGRASAHQQDRRRAPRRHGHRHAPRGRCRVARFRGARADQRDARRHGLRAVAPRHPLRRGGSRLLRGAGGARRPRHAARPRPARRSRRLAHGAARPLGRRLGLHAPRADRARTAASSSTSISGARERVAPSSTRGIAPTSPR